ncbi:hypothetical protein F5880DRAFT_1607136 [Lentinula raphanica]|nr:hypothetical protein F5880DRAFT_1607136 [Lentinula raphanica]
MTRRTLVLPLGIIFVFLASAIHPVVLAAPTGTTSFNEPERVPTRGDPGSSGRSGSLAGDTYAQDLSYCSPPPAGASGGGALKSNTAQWSRREESSDSFLQARADSGNGPSHEPEHHAAQEGSASTSAESAQLFRELGELENEVKGWQNEASRRFGTSNEGSVQVLKAHYYTTNHLKRLIEIMRKIVAIYHDEAGANFRVRAQAGLYLISTSDMLLMCKSFSPNDADLQRFIHSSDAAFANYFREGAGKPLIQ